MRIKSRLESSPCPPPRIAPPKADSWANFSQRIDKDDKNTRREAKEQYEQLGGDKLRPEIRETYMNQKGKKEVVVHGRRGGEMKSRVGPRGQVLDDGGAEGGGVLL